MLIPVTASRKTLEMSIGIYVVASDALTQKTFSTSVPIPSHQHNSHNLWNVPQCAEDNADRVIH